MKDVNINCWYCGAEQKELVEEISALTKENENLTNNYKNRLLDIQEFQNQIKALTEQVEKLKKEKQDLQLAFNIMNDPGKELSRLREERKEHLQIIRECKSKVLHCYEQSVKASAHEEFLKEDRDLMYRMEQSLNKFNDSKT